MYNDARCLLLLKLLTESSHVCQNIGFCCNMRYQCVCGGRDCRSVIPNNFRQVILSCVPFKLTVVQTRSVIGRHLMLLDEPIILVRMRPERVCICLVIPYEIQSPLSLNTLSALVALYLRQYHCHPSQQSKDRRQGAAATEAGRQTVRRHRKSMVIWCF